MPKLLLAAWLLAQTAENADVAITATVKAESLRFEIVPKVSVTFLGQNTATVWKTQRTNLPDQVQPYVTYRDIGIRLVITSTLPDIEKILDDALREPAPAPEREK